VGRRHRDLPRPHRLHVLTNSASEGCFRIGDGRRGGSLLALATMISVTENDGTGHLGAATVTSLRDSLRFPAAGQSIFGIPRIGTVSKSFPVVAS
jgi:hypothetical protein